MVMCKWTKSYTLTCERKIWVEMQPSLLLIEWYWQLTTESIYFVARWMMTRGENGKTSSESIKRNSHNQKTNFLENGAENLCTQKPISFIEGSKVWHIVAVSFYDRKAYCIKLSFRRKMFVYFPVQVIKQNHVFQAVKFWNTRIPGDYKRWIRLHTIHHIPCKVIYCRIMLYVAIMTVSTGYICCQQWLSVNRLTKAKFINYFIYFSQTHTLSYTHSHLQEWLVEHNSLA